MNVVNVLIMVLFACTSTLATAGWVVYDPINNQNIHLAGDIILSTQNPIAEKIFTSNLSTGPGQVAMVNCNGMGKQGYKGFFISIPDRVTIPNGGGAYLKLSLKNADFFLWKKNGEENIYTNWKPVSYYGPVCQKPGYVFPNVAWEWGAPSLQVELIDGWKVPAGEYKINTGFKYTYIEQYGENSDGRDAAILSTLNSSVVSSVAVKFKFEPKCNINTSDISLLFSPMTPDNSNLKESSKAPINISCDRDALVSLYLRGTSSVPGYSENFTRCGVNGACEVLFDNRAGSVVYKNVKSVNENVFSVFHPLGDLSAGEFNGNAIMTFFYE